MRLAPTGEQAATRSQPKHAIRNGMTMDCSKMFFTREMENALRKKLNVSQPEHITYMVANNVSDRRLLRYRKPSGIRSQKAAVPSSPKYRLKETNE